MTSVLDRPRLVTEGKLTALLNPKFMGRGRSSFACLRACGLKITCMYVKLLNVLST